MTRTRYNPKRYDAAWNWTYLGGGVAVGGGSVLFGSNTPGNVFACGLLVVGIALCLTLRWRP